MALVNQAKREINAKIVFFGPGGAGKATSIKHVFNKLKPEFRGAMKVMNVQDARMLFFDFTPPGDGNVDGFRVRFHLYTVSGPAVEPAAWKMVLKGADGVVFVADASLERMEDNRTALEELSAYLQGHGQSLAGVPAVLQFNKTDLPEALPVADLERVLNPSGLPVFKASAHTGEGVLQALMALVKTVLGSLRTRGTDALASTEGLQRMVEAPAAPEPVAARTEAKGEPEPEAPPVVPQAVREASPEPEEELSLEISGAPRAAGGDVISVPLTIRSGDREKKVVLTLSLAVEEG